MPEEDEVSLYDYIKVIAKRKWLIIIGTFACIFTAAIVTLLLPRVYQTRAILAMEGPSTPDVKIGLLSVPTCLSLDKFFNLLPSDRDLHLKVIRSLGLDKSPDNLTPQALGQMITFSLAKDSRMITVSVRYSHPEKAEDIANTMAEEVKGHYQVLNTLEISQSQNLVDEQLSLAQAQLAEAEKDLWAFKETVDVDSLRNEIKTQSSQETNLSQEYSKISMSLVEEEARLARAREELQKQDRFYILSKSIAQDAAYKGILDELSEEDISASQRVEGASQQINPIYLNLQQTVTNAHISIAGAKAKEALFMERIEENSLGLSKLRAQLAENEPEWESLLEVHDLATKDYQGIRSAHRGASKLLAAATTRQLKTIRTAAVPSRPIEPKTKRILLVAATVGLLAVLLLAFFLEYLEKMRRVETESKRQED